MVTVRINGEESSVNGDNMPKITDLIELIKSSIDPDHMITNILIDGEGLSDDDWTASTSKFNSSVLDIETGTPDLYVATRIIEMPVLVGSIYSKFRDSRKCFQSGDMATGNKVLGEATRDLQALFEWYGTLMELVPEEDKKKYDLAEEIDEIASTCSTICQQQLYQSWWSLGSTIEEKLEKQLDKLEDRCREFKAAPVQ